MRSFFQNKKFTLLLAILALSALTVLALGLKDVQFKAAQPLGRRDIQLPAIDFDLTQTFKEGAFRSQVVFWIVAILLVSLVSLLLTPDGRKRLLRLLWRLFASYWLLYFVFKKYGTKIASVLNLSFGGFPPSQPNGETTEVPPPVFVPPQPSSWLSYLVSILLVLVFVILFWRAWVFWKQVSLAYNEKPLEELAKIARSSLHDLSQGGDSTDVIMKCYFRMSSVVSDKRRLHRKDSMTPAEFAVRLEEAGLPGDAVQRLTRLFEAVRYGGHRTQQKDVNEAVACLTSILAYCGESV
jgi:hypothetical protein